MNLFHVKMEWVNVSTYDRVAWLGSHMFLSPECIVIWANTTQFKIGIICNEIALAVALNFFQTCTDMRNSPNKIFPKFMTHIYHREYRKNFSNKSHLKMRLFPREFSRVISMRFGGEKLPGKITHRGVDVEAFFYDHKYLTRTLHPEVWFHISKKNTFLLSEIWSSE